MDLWIVVVIAAVVLVVALVLIWLAMRGRRQSDELRSRFGPEYERAVDEHGGRKQAEEALKQRKQHVERLRLRELEPEERDRYADAWRGAQNRFVDDPRGAIAEADEIVSDVMEARGYPIGDFEQRAADISVDHPGVVQNYRAAHAIANRNQRGDATTEEMRQAMVSYRSLFDDLLDVSDQKRTEAA